MQYRPEQDFIQYLKAKKRKKNLKKIHNMYNLKKIILKLFNSTTPSLNFPSPGFFKLSKMVTLI